MENVNLEKTLQKYVLDDTIISNINDLGNSVYETNEIDFKTYYDSNMITNRHNFPHPNTSPKNHKILEIDNITQTKNENKRYENLYSSENYLGFSSDNYIDNNNDNIIIPNSSRSLKEHNKINTKSKIDDQFPTTVLDSFKVNQTKKRHYLNPDNEISIIKESFSSSSSNDIQIPLSPKIITLNNADECIAKCRNCGISLFKIFDKNKDWSDCETKTLKFDQSIFFKNVLIFDNIYSLNKLNSNSNSNSFLHKKSEFSITPNIVKNDIKFLDNIDSSNTNLIIVLKSVNIKDKNNEIIIVKTNLLFCQLCCSLIGFHKLNSNSTNFLEKNQYFIFERKINKSSNLLNVVIASLRLDKIDLIYETINNLLLINEKKNINIIKKRISKENKVDVKEIETLNPDLLIIIHKIDLRTLLVGKNGFYNLIINDLYTSLSKALLI